MSDGDPQLDIAVHLTLDAPHMLTVLFQRIDAVGNLRTDRVAVHRRLSLKDRVGIAADIAAAARAMAEIAQHDCAGTDFCALKSIVRALRRRTGSYHEGIDHPEFFNG